MITALMLVPLAMKFSTKKVHIAALFGTAIVLFMLPFIKMNILFFSDDTFRNWLAAIMGLPYSMVSPDIPAEKRERLYGIINMMIVIPMLIQTISFGFIYKIYWKQPLLMQFY